MKIILASLMLVAWPHLFAGPTSHSKQQTNCVDDAGNPKQDSHCVCYMKKTVCSDGVSACAEHVCEQKACSVDDDCSFIPAKCVDGFCKK